MTTYEEWAKAHGNHDDPYVVWESGFSPPRPQYRASLSTNWSHLGFGVDVEREWASAHWPNHLWVAFKLGPWALTLTRTWGEGQ